MMCFFFQAEDGIRDLVRSRGLGDVYKRQPSHRPDWLGTVDDPGDRRGAIAACALDEPASLVWTANLAALELHTHMAKGRDLDAPTMLVLDLDPGPGVDLAGCCEAVSYTHLRAHETVLDLVCRLLLEKQKNQSTLTALHPP